MSDSPSSKKSGDLDAALYHASRYRALAKVGHSLSGYETSAVAMLEEIERLQEDVSRYESGRVVLTGEIERLRMAERLNVETVARLQQERDRLAGQLDAAEQHVKILREERYSQPPNGDLRPWDIMVICDAYESGMGHGLAGDGLPNPYSEFSHQYMAYARGHEEGVERRGKAMAPLPSIDEIAEAEGLSVTKSEKCSCGAELPPLAQWSMPNCPQCVAAAETNAPLCSCPISECLDQPGKRCKDDL